MGSRRGQALSAVRVRTAKKPGRYADGNGLNLLIDLAGNKRWTQRLTIRGNRTDLGLGSYPLVSLGEAREQAFANRKLARAGGDPRAEKRRVAIPTFTEAAARVIDLRRPEWRHPKTTEHWEARLRNYAYPVLGHLPLDKITGADVLRVLSPVWTGKPEMARHVRGYMREVFDWAIGSGYRSDNPAGDAVRLALRRVRRTRKHYKAVHYTEVANALKAIRASKASPASKLSLEFQVLTATRPGEARNARWSEVDLATCTWTIPLERMKAEREHRVPLSERAIEILVEARSISSESGLVFVSVTDITHSADTFTTPRSRPPRSRGCGSNSRGYGRSDQWTIGWFTLPYLRNAMRSETIQTALTASGRSKGGP